MPDMAVRTNFIAADRVSATFGRMGNAADRFARRGTAALARVNRVTDRMLGGLKGFLPAMGAYAVIDFANKSVDAFQESQAAVANVNAGLKSTNNAIGLTSKQITDMAAAWQQVGIFEDDAILQNVSAQLLTFGNIGKYNFDRVQRAVMDVTAKLDGVNATSESLRNRSIMLGKAMNDPIKGMNAMNRVGISFSKQEADTIKSMAAHGDLLGAQNMMLRIIEKQYGGTNEALRKTDKGMERFTKNKMNDTMELIGEQIVPLKKSLFEFAARILPMINKALPPILKVIEKIAPILPYIVSSILALKVIVPVAKGFFLFTKAVKASIFFCQMWKAVGLYKTIILYASGTKLATGTTWGWVAAQKALNFAVKAFPLFALVALIVYAAKKIRESVINWDEWGAGMMSMSGTIGGMVTNIMALVRAIDALRNGKSIGEALSILQTKLTRGTPQIKTGQATTGYQQYSKNKEAPNQAEANAQFKNNVNVNLYNANPGSSAKVSPKRGANVNMVMAGAN